MRPFLLICVAPILLGSCVQAASNLNDIGSHEDVDRISSRESAAFDRYNIEEINCGHTYLDPIKELLRQHEAAQTDKLFDALNQCSVDAQARLKTQLWGNIVEVNFSSAQTPPNWSKISSQNDNAITRYYSEAKVCADRLWKGPLGEAIKKAGDEALKWQSQIDEGLGKVEKCQIEAAASLKAQLQLP